MHRGKTKFMSNNNAGDAVKLGEDTIEKEEVYKYLGQEIRMKNSAEEEIKTRIRSGWACFHTYKRILTSKEIPISVKSRIFNQCILPTITYGCQTWTLNINLRNKIRSAQRSMERKMLNIPLLQQINHSHIRQRTKVMDFVEYICKMKWRWAGHVA